MVAIDVIARDRASATFRKIGQSTEATAGRLSKFSKSMDGALTRVSKLGAVAVGAVAANQLQQFLGSAVTQASNLQQNVGAVEAVFKNTAKAVEEFGKTSSTTVGLAKSDYLGMAVTFGSQLKNMGVSSDQLVPKTNQLIKLGSDLSAMYGGTVSDAVEAISALLRGETDPIQRYGVTIMQSGVNAYEAAKGLTHLTGQAKVNADTTARLALLYQQTKDAQGQFADQTDTLAESQQIANAKFAEAKAEIGTKLLPVITNLTTFASNTLIPILGTVGGAVGDVVGGVTDAVSWFGKLPGPVKAAGAALAGLAIANKIGLLSRLSAAARGVGSTFTSFGSSIARIGDDAAMAGVSRMRVGIGLVGSAAKTAGAKVVSAFGGPWGLAIAAAPFAIDLVASAFKHAGPPAHDFTDAIDENTGALKKNWAQSIATTLANDGTIDKLNKVGVSVSDYTAALMGNMDAYKRVTDQAQKYTGLQKIGGEVINQLYADHQKYTEQITHAKQAQKAATAIQDQATASNKKAASATVSFQAAQDRYARSLDNSAYVTTRATAATQAQNTAYNDARRALNNYGTVAKVMAEQVRQGAQDTSVKVLNVARSFQVASQDAGTLASSMDQVKAALDRLEGKEPGVEQATRQFQGALTAAKEAAKNADGKIQMFGSGVLTAAGKIKLGSKAGQQLYDTVTQNADAARDLALAQAKAAGKTGGLVAAGDAAARSQARSRQAFINNAKQMGVTAAQAKKLADRYFDLPSDLKIEVYGVSDFAAVDNKLQSLANTTHYVRLQGKLVGISTSNSWGLGTGGATKSFSVANGFLASGGPAKPGRRYVVGENGPEVLDMYAGGGGFVHNNSQYRKMMTAGLPGRASGGPVGYTPPSAGGLAGVQAFNPGPVMSVIKSALQTFWGALGATATAARDASKNMRQAEKTYRQQVAEQGKTAREQTANLVKTRHEQIAAVNAAHKAIAASRAEGKSAVAEAQRSYNDANRRSLRSVNDAKTNLARVRAQAKQDRADAKADVDAAKPGRERQDALKRLRDVIQRNGRDIADASKDLNRAEQDRATTLRDAQRELDKARKDADAGVATAEKNYRKAKLAAAKAVNAATKAQQRANVAERRKTAAAAKAAKTAEQAAAVEKRRAIAVQAMEKRTVGLRKQQAQLGRTLDSVNDKLATAKTNLASLKDARSQLSGSISGQITGDTSIMNLNATGVKGILAGLQSNLSQAKSFQSAIAKLTKGGLNNKTLQEIAGGGLAAGPLAKVLASATPQQIRQLNRLQSEIAKSAGRTGNTVADAQYAKSIKEQSQVVASFAGLKQEIKDALKEGSHELSQAFQAGIEGMTVQFKMGDETINAKIERIVKADMKKQAHAMTGSRP